MVLDAETLKLTMSQPFEWFAEMGELHVGKNYRGANARHIYIDRGSNILGVAHLDSVQPFKGFWINNDYIQCSTVDNRMGAWLMLYGLPQLGINFDVLLTENEERGMSTAGDFTKNKDYNWAFSFDRSGTDVVCYQYYDTEVGKMFDYYGLRSDYGSYSDVADLEIGVKGFNFGVGMYSYHSENAYVRLWELDEVIEKFTCFYHDKHDEAMPHVEKYIRYYDEYYSYEKPIIINGKPYNPPREWEDDEWWDRNSKTETEAKPITSLVKSRAWNDYLDNYFADQAIRNPTEFFIDADDPVDWWHSHTFGDINDVDPDSELGKMYFDGSLSCCNWCENLFVKTDVDYYPSVGSRICKACFHSHVVSLGR